MLKAIQLYIASDIQTTLTPAASTVWQKNQDLWPNFSTFPDYPWKPFGVIWIGSSAASSDVANRTVYKMGSNLEESRGEITLLGCPVESTLVNNDGLFSNAIGEETMYLDIVLRLPQERQNFDKIMNAELRLRWLLDESWRKYRKVAPYIANLGDPLIGGNLRLTWKRYMVPPNAKEVWSRYAVCYERLVPHS